MIAGRATVSARPAKDPAETELGPAGADCDRAGCVGVKDSANAPMIDSLRKPHGTLLSHPTDNGDRNASANDREPAYKWSLWITPAC